MSELRWPADWDVKYPNASVMMDAREALVCSCYYTTKEFGEILREMDRALVEGRWDFVESLPWTGRVYKGYTTSSRPGLSANIKADVLVEGACRVCGSPDELEVDHIKPWSRGGTHKRKNLQPLCMPCNRSKGSKTMKEWLG